MTTTQYTINATINIGGTYDASKYILGNIFPNETQELIPLLTNAQVQALSFPASQVGYKVYNTTLDGMYIWDGFEWSLTNNAVASTLVANTSSGQTQIDISTTNPPTAGQALVAISSTKAAWSNVSGGGGTPSYNSSYVGTVGDGITKNINVNHGLGTINILVGVWEASGPMSEVDCSITIIDANNVLFGFYTAPALNAIKIIIVSSVATNIVPNQLPTQTGFAGDYLTTNGTNAFWTPISIPVSLPIIGSGTIGEFLTNDGNSTFWANVLPPQIGNNGYFLTTNGSNVSWGIVPPPLPTQTGKAGDYLTTDGTNASWVPPNDIFPNQAPYSAGGYYLYTNGTTASWQLTPSWLQNPMTAAGDIIVGGTSGAAGRLGIGTAGQSLTVTSSTTLGWVSLIPAISSITTGEFLTNNGTIASWTPINQVPAVTGGISGYVLSNNGTISQWIYNTAPPSVSGQAGNFLTNNGTIVQWAAINQLPSINGTTAGKFLENDGSTYFWASALSNPMTTYGDIIIGGFGGTSQKLAIGSVGQVLTVYNEGSYLYAQWASAALTNPMTAYGDIIIGGASGSAIRLAVGSVGQVLTVYDTGLGHYSLQWASSLVNPMTSVGDIIYGTTSGGPVRLGIGGAGTVLTSVSGIPAWTTIIPPLVPSEFLTNNGTTVSWGTVPNTLPSQAGNSGNFLTTNGSVASWATIPAGFTNPMTATGDLIVGGSGGTAGKLSVGSNTQVLTVVSGSPAWAAIPSQIPSQTGNSGYYLTTNGSVTSWGQITQLVPTVSSGTNGDFLTNNGTTFYWGALPNQVPSQTGLSGDFLTTNGTTMSWAPIITLPAVNGGTSGQILSNNGTTVQWVSEASVASLGTLPFNFTSGSLAVGYGEIDTVSAACYAFQIFTISVSSPCRIRFYGTYATALADNIRPSTAVPSGNVGLMAEFVFLSTQLSWICSPVPICFNNDSTLTQNIYIAIQNTGTSTTTITINATILKME